MNHNFEHVTQLLKKLLPGVGPRQAARFVLALLDKDEPDLKELGHAISTLKREITFCPQCFNVSDNHLCHVCEDSRRDKTKILVVEKVTDLDSIEKTGLYKGLYHVLGGALNPLENITPQNLKIKQLENRVAEVGKDQSVELIIATNPTTAGETTALYLRDLFYQKSNIVLTGLARGLASGSMLEYADEGTLKHALDNRR